MTNSADIIYTKVDEAPELASSSFLPIVKAFTSAAGVSVATKDISLARTILTIPINPTFGSINLAQAVVLCAYELSIGASLIQPTVSDLEAPATQKDLEGLITHLSTMLKKKGYFMPPDRATATQKTLRNILTKPAWSENEIRTLRGVLSTLERKDRP